ncbi:MAG: hypothetical protein ACRCYK_15315, partial [Aeromonas hydrophila]
MFSEWSPDPEIYIDWKGMPVGIPEECIPSLNMLIFLPHKQSHRNPKWINYIWYIQEWFINHIVAALKLITEQLHATTLMTVQNWFAIDTMRGPECVRCSVLNAVQLFPCIRVHWAHSVPCWTAWRLAVIR